MPDIRTLRSWLLEAALIPALGAMALAAVLRRHYQRRLGLER